MKYMRDCHLPQRHKCLMQIGQAVMFLHSSNPPLAHLDIKPANILAGRQFLKGSLSKVDSTSYKVYLADFGLARVLNVTPTIGSKTMLAGTPGFQPPEQLRAESIGTACDVCAYGGVLEKPLWPGLSAFQVMSKMTVSREMPVLGHLPGFIQAVCR